MPGFDRTGPRGMGSMTGGGRGYCAMPVGNRFPGRGFASGLGRPFGAFGRGRGLGLGRRASWGSQDFGAAEMAPSNAPMTEEQELTGLRQQAQSIQGELEQIQRRIRELDR
jgi:hypothetical protein